MKKMTLKKLLLVSIAFISLGIKAQETYYVPNTNDIESLVTIEDNSIRKYLAMNIKYPIDAQKQGICGTYIGCIRISQEGDLIDVFTINPLTSSIDHQFVSLMKKAWSKKQVKLLPLNDITDIIVAISYKLSNGIGQEPFNFHVDKELFTKNILDEVAIVAYPRDYTIPQPITDKQLIEQANEMYKDGKYKQCIKSINELIRRNPYNADLFYMRAKSFIGLEKEDDARRDYLYIKNFLSSEKYKSLEPDLQTTASK